MMRRTVIASLAAAGILAAMPLAAEPPAFREFTFKRVKPGQQPLGKRITVQIDPEEQARYLAVPKKKEDSKEDVAAVALGPAAPPGATYDWYWQGVSPDLVDTRPGRLSEAVKMLTQGPEGQTVRAPRLATLKKIADAHGTDILKATIGTDVSPALVLAIIGIESSGDVTAVSSAGAQGLMQLMPATAKRFGVEDSEDAAQNIKGGVTYLDWLMKEFKRDPLLVLAGYNAGEGAIKKHGGVPPFAETRDYVPKVLAAWTVARGLCQTPPELISDGCVFFPKGG